LRVGAALLSAWVGLRWLGFLLGLVRLRSFERGGVRREARRTVIARGAWNVFFSVIAVYVWSSVTREQPSETLVGFMAAALMCSLLFGVAAFFMQPEERTPETLEVCRIFRSRPKSEEPSPEVEPRATE
jgi:hypothetical protein